MNKDYIIRENILVQYKGKDENAEIPNGVIGIGGSAFYGCSFLKNVTIPEDRKSVV